MSVPGVLLFLAAVCVVWAVVSAMRITAVLDKAGIKTPFLLIRLFLFRNLSRYKEVTLRETGKVGPLFHHYVIAINAAWILALVAWAARSLI